MWKIVKSTTGTNLTKGIFGVGLACLVLIAVTSVSVHAMTFTSSNYVIDTAVLNNTGGSSSSTSYKLESSGGEAAIGEGTSGSYKLAAGYVAQLTSASSPSITVTTQPNGLIGQYSFDEAS